MHPSSDCHRLRNQIFLEIPLLPSRRDGLSPGSSRPSVFQRRSSVSSGVLTRLFICFSCKHAVRPSTTVFQSLYFISSHSTIRSAAYIHYRSHSASHTYSVLGWLDITTLHDARIRVFPGRNNGRYKTPLDTRRPPLLRHFIVDCRSYLDL